MVERIEVNGLSVAYELSGPEDGPRVVLSHSLAADHTMWAGQMPALGGYRVLRYDLRGHGATQVTPGPYSIEQLTEDAAGLIQALDLAPVRFVGLSLGGMIGQILGVRHASLVSALVLCDTASHMPPAELWDERAAIARDAGLGEIAPATVERWFTAGFRASDGATVAGIEAMIRATPAEGYAACGEAIREMDLRGTLSAIAKPTLVMVGADDPATPPGASEAIAGEIDGAQLVVLEKAAHLSNVEQPQSFNQALLAFLEGASA